MTLLPPKDFRNKISKVVAAWATTVTVSKDFARLDVRVRESRKDYATAAAAPAAAAPAAAPPAAPLERSCSSRGGFKINDVF